MRAAVLSVGAELLRGDIVDTNAAYLARELCSLGFEVVEQETAGDVLGPLVTAVRHCLDLADVVVATGGLGPTEDDLTREAIAEAVGEEPRVDEDLAAQIEARFRGMGRTMPERNRKQAMVIPSGEAILNPNGTAPGWLVRSAGHVIAALPGPPFEMEPMWRDSIRPVLTDLLPGCLASRSLMTFGLGESAVEEGIRDVIHYRESVIVATYAKSAGVQVHVSARAPSQAEAEEQVEEAVGMVRGRLGPTIFATGNTTLSRVVNELLRERGLTLSVMESCTGGLLGSLITDTDGSSETFRGGIIAYSQQEKERHGVRPEIIAQYGIYSEETALAMAEAIRSEMGTDIGIGVTGIAGSDALDGVAPGSCFIAVAVNGRTAVQDVHRPGERHTAKRYFAQTALDLLRRELLRDDT